MSKSVRNTTPDDVTIPSLGLTVPAGQVADVPDEVADELVARPGWAAATAPKVPKVADVLAEVDGDPARAAAALATEQARGDKARTSLVEQLATIVEAPASETTNPEGD